MYQKHSETSREAYNNLSTAKADAERIYALVESYGTTGICAPKVAELLDLVPGTVAARVITLERNKRVVKLQRTEKSPSGHSANVMVAAKFVASLAPGDRVLSTKPADPKATREDGEAIDVLKEVENLIRLGAPILYGSALHKRIEALVK